MTEPTYDPQTGLLLSGKDFPFKCPACGGHHFGHIPRTIMPKVTFDRVECHDQFKKKCKWKFVYPKEEE